jgi:hypothetical protein
LEKWNCILLRNDGPASTLKTPEGRKYKTGDLGNPDLRPNLIYDYKGCKPPPHGWAVSLETMKKMDKEGRLEFPKKPGGRLMRRPFWMNGRESQSNLSGMIFPRLIHRPQSD